jgi:hypothetical protein
MDVGSGQLSILDIIENQEEEQSVKPRKQVGLRRELREIRPRLGVS